jgi:hypothetical protein
MLTEGRPVFFLKLETQSEVLNSLVANIYNLANTDPTSGGDFATGMGILHDV